MAKIPFLKKGSTISLFLLFYHKMRLLMVKILLKRIYEEPSEADGYRILLDRLWPRGLKKEDAKFDEWRKDITPSKELRQWFHEDKDRHWEVFQGATGWRSSRTRISFLSYERSRSIRLSLSSRQRRMYNIVIYLY